MKKIFSIFILIVCCMSVFGADIDHAKPYNETLDKAGTVLQLATMATGVVLLREKASEYPKIGTMYIETIGLTFAVKEALKHFIPRSRPYTYFDNAPVEDIADWSKSFPSGHAAFAFAAATFTSYVFCKYRPDSKAKLPVVIGSYALATATACLRVESGNHFVTDVLAGALIGSAIGFAVPAIHHRFASKNIETQVSPFSFLIKLSF